MIKLVERHVCDLCGLEFVDHACGRECLTCNREVCGHCFKSYSFPHTALQGNTCSHCQEVLHREPHMKEALDKFLQQWKLLSIRERDLSANP